MKDIDKLVTVIENQKLEIEQLKKELEYKNREINYLYDEIGQIKYDYDNLYNNNLRLVSEIKELGGN